MAFSKLSYAEINNIANQLKSKATEMNTLLNNQIKQQMNKIGTDGVWSGDAAMQVKAEFDALSGRFGDFVEAVTSCSTYLNKMVENYQSVDTAINKAIK